MTSDKNIPKYLLEKSVVSQRIFPYIYNPSILKHRTQLQKLSKNKAVKIAFDDFANQLEELYLIRHPKLRFDRAQASIQSKAFVSTLSSKIPLWQRGRWVYFPWSSTLVHVLDKNLFFELRTSRNQNLITKKEQKKLQKMIFGVAGLSVGNSVATNLALEGIEQFRFADFDTLGLSNLNRIRSGLSSLGLNKVHITAQQIYEMNPYAKIKMYSNGLNEKILQKFIGGSPVLNALIDEIDDVVMKIRLRLLARKMRIPVVSVADNGDNCIVDVERYDLEPKRPIYHGLLGKVNPNKVAQMNFGERFKLINKMVGQKFVTRRMKESLALVGSKLYTWPQLGGAASLSGAVATMVVRRIVLGEKIISGKYNINLDKFFIK